MEKHGRKLKKKFKIMLVIVAILLIGIATLLGTFCYFKSPVSNDKKEVSVVIESGSTISDIATLLKKEGLIKNEAFFKLYVKLKNVSNVYAAKYYFSPSMNLDKIINTLKKGGVNENEISITFKEGINIRNIAKLIKENTSNSEEDVYKILKDEKYLNSIIEKYWFLTNDIKNSKIYYSLEGYLFPDTYRFNNKDVSVEEIFNKMLDQMEKELSKYRNDIEKSKYSVHELITLASIIELEGANSNDRKGVAGVFYNRLEDNWNLGSDVTTYYAVKINMSDRDLRKSEINDCTNKYNTRCTSLIGLPIGPISNPGIESIEAVLNPTKSDYYYFVADKTGKTYFNKTYEEHNKTIQTLKNNDMWFEY